MQPLAERLRPRSLAEYVGQQHLVGPEGPIARMVEQKRLSPFILWGPPGVGKTTLARLLSQEVKVRFYSLSAISAGVKEVRAVLDQAKGEAIYGAPILFIDEIHRFNKAQQDSLLGAVEQGAVTLIGATTENPSFSVISPLLSRCQVYTLKPLSVEELERVLIRALTEDALLAATQPELRESEALYTYAAGDARRMLNILELLYNARPKDAPLVITNALVVTQLQRPSARYDRAGDMHYDVISAFIKSVRGSDPQGAIYWMARMLDAGEDPLFVARRLVILSAEDIGLADPNGLLIAQAAQRAVQEIGMPEARIVLAEAAIYLATAPKSNSAYMAINEALGLVAKDTHRDVPLHLRNAATGLMGNLGYGEGYMYAHDYPGHFAYQEFLPEGLEGHAFYRPQDNPRETQVAARQAGLWGNKYER